MNQDIEVWLQEVRETFLQWHASLQCAIHPLVMRRTVHIAIRAIHFPSNPFHSDSESAERGTDCGPAACRKKLELSPHLSRIDSHCEFRINRRGYSVIKGILNLPPNL